MLRAARRAAHLLRLTATCWGTNLVSRERVTGSAPVVVSLASFGRRTKTAHLAVESVAAGSARPSRIVVWLDESDEGAPLPRPLRRLVSRGLEVRYAPAAWGPHKKYYPLAAERTGVPVITADDDIFYPPTWLADLERATSGFRSADVVAHRVHVLQLEQGRVAPYATWPSCATTEPSLLHFPTGTSGRYIPVALLEELAERGTAFLETCPRADDVWLHAVSVRASVATRQVEARGHHFPQVPGSQLEGLYRHNVERSGNDEQVRATYEPQDLAVLAAAAGAVRTSEPRPGTADPSDGR
ncbi:hypothetical protein [uncultured Pseudokineococcus sp.]|uniref:hypothetical protein n=1 Tax=uncultured Pseudokineococcus sp. TaxID=1642928 RepID=UPI002625DB9A|nr:hypothetical protein [uncultured Pseudokineococcus sp.]